MAVNHLILLRYLTLLPFANFGFIKQIYFNYFTYRSAYVLEVYFIYHCKSIFTIFQLSSHFDLCLSFIFLIFLYSFNFYIENWNIISLSNQTYINDNAHWLSMLIFDLQYLFAKLISERSKTMEILGANTFFTSS